mmetsp:Transcript_40981/g.131792  ORF Transcript_40981/g.131792 Transcript_40981/m.131792 type:complete len:99 (-) Transcript_40981:287-583(-)
MWRVFILGIAPLRWSPRGTTTLTQAVLVDDVNASFTELCRHLGLPDTSAALESRTDKSWLRFPFFTLLTERLGGPALCVPALHERSRTPESDPWRGRA